MMAVTPLSLSQRNSRRSSARRIAVVGQAGEQRLDGVQHDALGADRVDGVAQADEQPLQVVLAGLLDLAPLDAHVVDARASCRRPAGRGRSRASATFLASSSAVSSKRHEDARLVVLASPRGRGTPCASSVLPQPALPQTSVGRPRGRPPPVISSSPSMPVGHFSNRDHASVAAPHRQGDARSPAQALAGEQVDDFALAPVSSAIGPSPEACNAMYGPLA